MESYGYDASDPEYIDDQAYLDGLLSFMKLNMVGRHHRDTDQPWIDQALQVHATEPFSCDLGKSRDRRTWSSNHARRCAIVCRIRVGTCLLSMSQPRR